MAEALFSRIVSESKAVGETPGEMAPMPEGGVGGERLDISALSAGISAHEGDPATPEAIAALGERGLDISGHRARQLTAEMIAEADLILTMTAVHKNFVLRVNPAASGKVFTIKEFARGAMEETPDADTVKTSAADKPTGSPGPREEPASGESLDLPDPFGLGLEVYRATAAELERELRRVVERLRRLA